jgi:hypothetical protein
VLCTHCGQWNPDTQPTVTPPKSPDAHYTASALIAELCDLREQLSGAQAAAKKFKGLYAETIKIIENAARTAQEERK